MWMTGKEIGTFGPNSATSVALFLYVNKLHPSVAAWHLLSHCNDQKHSVVQLEWNYNWNTLVLRTGDVRSSFRVFTNKPKPCKQLWNQSKCTHKLRETIMECDMTVLAQFRTIQAAWIWRCACFCSSLASSRLQERSFCSQWPSVQHSTCQNIAKAAMWVICMR